MLPSSKMTITLNMRNSTRECSLPVCKVCAMPLPFLALRLGDLARAAGLRAGDFARAGDLARPRGFGAGEAARLALRVATMVDATRRRREAALNLLHLQEGCVVSPGAPLCSACAINRRRSTACASQFLLFSCVRRLHAASQKQSPEEQASKKRHCWLRLASKQRCKT